MVRLEFFSIAVEVLKEKPLFGLGFNSPLSRFIPNDYESKIFPRNGKHSFHDMVANLNVFDNMALTFLGETGGLFSAAYFCLIFYLIKSKAAYYNEAEKRRLGSLLIVIAGFLAHSMTFDSLKYPHLNWVFHSLLGLLAQSKRIKPKTSTWKSINPWRAYPKFHNLKFSKMSKRFLKFTGWVSCIYTFLFI